MNKVPDLPEREPPVAATESLVRPQDEQTLEPSSSPRAPMQDSSQAVPLQAGNLGTRPHASTAPATGGSLPAGGKAEVDAPNLPLLAWSRQPRHSRRPRRTKPPRWCPRKGSGRTGRQLQQGRPLPLRPIQRRLWLRRQRRRPRRQPRKRSGRTGCQLQKRRPVPLRPIQRRLWPRSQRRRPRRQPHKRSDQTGCPLQKRRPVPLRPIRRLWLRGQSRTKRPQRMCRTSLRSHQHRRSIQRKNRL